jgi:hypothetical protein
MSLTPQKKQNIGDSQFFTHLFFLIPGFIPGFGRQEIYRFFPVHKKAGI